MAVTHSTITDPDIHESKGVNTAPANSVYMATGTGTGVWTALPDPDPNIIGVKVGSICFYAGSTEPDKWLFCAGQAVSRSIYADLFAVVGLEYGAGDGSTTFNLPDLRGRLAAGKNDMGGVDVGRLTGSVNGSVLGGFGGTETVTLTSNNIPVLTPVVETTGSHTHVVDNAVGSDGAGYAATGSNNNTFVSSAGSLAQFVSRSLSSAGAHTHTVTMNPSGGQAHNNTQPVIVLNALIYTGV